MPRLHSSSSSDYRRLRADRPEPPPSPAASAPGRYIRGCGRRRCASCRRLRRRLHRCLRLRLHRRQLRSFSACAGGVARSECGIPARTCRRACRCRASLRRGSQRPRAHSRRLLAQYPSRASNPLVCGHCRAITAATTHASSLIDRALGTRPCDSSRRVRAPFRVHRAASAAPWRPRSVARDAEVVA